MKRSVLWVSLLTLAAACGGRSTDVLDDEPSDEPTSGVGGGQGMGGSGGGQATAGSGGAQATAGSGGAQGLAGAGGTTGPTTPSGTKPIGEDQPCVSDADCAGFEATFCDIFVSNTCLVRGCSVAPDSCFAGKECCDLAAFGLPSLCVAAGACLD